MACPRDSSLVYRRGILGLNSALCDLRWWIFRHLESWRRQSQIHSRDTITNLRIQSAGEDSDHSQSTAWLRQALRRNPCWGAGHLYLGERALTLRDFQLAFASAQAVTVLPNLSKSVTCRAQLLLGQTYLALGEGRSACDILRDLVTDPDIGIQAKEDLAAALVQIGELDEALRTLNSVPVASLTSHGHSAKEWLTRGIRDKTEG